MKTKETNTEKPDPKLMASLGLLATAMSSFYFGNLALKFFNQGT